MFRGIVLTCPCLQGNFVQPKLLGQGGNNKVAQVTYGGACNPLYRTVALKYIDVRPSLASLCPLSCACHLHASASCICHAAQNVRACYCLLHLKALSTVRSAALPTYGLTSPTCCMLLQPHKDLAAEDAKLLKETWAIKHIGAHPCIPRFLGFATTQACGKPVPVALVMELMAGGNLLGLIKCGCFAPRPLLSSSLHARESCCLVTDRLLQAAAAHMLVGVKRPAADHHMCMQACD